MLDEHDRIGNLNAMARWLMRFAIMEIGARRLSDATLSANYRATYMGLMAEAVGMLYGDEQRAVLLDELTQGGYTTLKSAKDNGASEAELDAIAKGLVNTKKGTVQ